MEKDPMEMTDAELEAEEKSLMDEIIQHDQSLTPEQRKQHRHKVNLNHFREGLKRVSKLLDLNAPEVILAYAVTNLYSRAWSLWEEGMADTMVTRMKESARGRSDRCINCATDLPYPADKSGLCPGCIKDVEENY